MFTLSQHEQHYLLRVARCAIDTVLAPHTSGTLPTSPHGMVDEPLGAFVTLHLGGYLRGCIGNMIGRAPLHETVAQMARSAAFDDTRFRPLTSQEWAQTSLEISVLGPLTPCPDVAAIELARHGLWLTLHGNSGVFLPQVATEQGWDVPTLLEQLCYKAELPVGSWKDPQAQLLWFEAAVFGETQGK